MAPKHGTETDQVFNEDTKLKQCHDRNFSSYSSVYLSQRLMLIRYVYPGKGNVPYVMLKSLRYVNFPNH
ncbi:uncharacterized protein P174DRAFT_72509 [Aspergillus novofumigatus IBT 16806]|uniref:Uncharacterized protein n=1 Tax=Aspergillus novofumigatus (strain IBT 16806) TaxID=1392255 RepID=A0A2I1BST7_ASPN1|nr:uncharacterized protein P174DRAFT_118457 [Aspergillus novofumigatus IBT 16806]XP_024677050.1 uncharacterized protein P174DRAFT_72509 [Aspergillus novofumigatus IBT 16806]PKX88250.1 hypothetical protein P174DRAFT_118457 [Aspergillus novofumigatus IBT 16806]PKX88455.1 hypothetical protein P174DRAFT_72509 [Aspergillus novofumigatus IBT 16806]